MPSCTYSKYPQHSPRAPRPVRCWSTPPPQAGLPGPGIGMGKLTCVVPLDHHTWVFFPTIIYYTGPSTKLSKGLGGSRFPNYIVYSLICKCVNNWIYFLKSTYIYIYIYLFTYLLFHLFVHLSMCVFFKTNLTYDSVKYIPRLATGHTMVAALWGLIKYSFLKANSCNDPQT